MSQDPDNGGKQPGPEEQAKPEQVEPEQGGNAGLGDLADALSPVVAPEQTDEKRLAEPDAGKDG
ncbi:hypothetical protein [Paenarthrobacter sp. NPDC089316]|uniref:hypothetical protein n=1 Tax=unclassified Paenarthrobacter TaxID=2634190 RepID=UPI003419065A